MKKTLLTATAVSLISLSTGSAQAFLGLNFGLADIRMGLATVNPAGHETSLCVGSGGSSCVDIPFVLSMWFDYGMLAATAIDYFASQQQDERTIDASEAIEKLEEALKGSGSGSGGSSGSDGEISQEVESAAAYVTENIMTEIEVTNKSSEGVFNSTRNAIRDYLFETADPAINGTCDRADKDCAETRQTEWLLASVALASATADKVLDQKSGSQLGSLAAGFNSQTNPAGLYNAMASIVLDTQRQTNDANALLGRDLEAQGLRAAVETGTQVLSNSEEEED